jgi:hypothetical protein
MKFMFVQNSKGKSALAQVFVRSLMASLSGCFACMKRSVMKVLQSCDEDTNSGCLLLGAGVVFFSCGLTYVAVMLAFWSNFQGALLRHKVLTMLCFNFKCGFTTEIG